MSDSDNFEINWPQEIMGGAAAAGEEVVDKKIPEIENRLLDKVLEKAKQDNLFNFNFGQHFSEIAGKIKGLDLFHKVVKKVCNLFKIAGRSATILDLIFLGFDVFGIWSSDKSLENKFYETGKSIVGTLGGIVGGGTAGAIAGSFFGPIGTGIGAIAGSIIGGFLAQKLYESIIDAVKIIAGAFNNLMKFITGGVEFTFPREISEFKNNFIFDKCHFIGFEYDDDNFNINSIVDLINSKFLVNNIKAKNINQIYETILQEIAYGFLYNKELPFISLNFNKESLLYSIMDDYYKNTLTGNILTFLDYYLKSYVNNGFFKEEFIFEWQNNKNTNKDYLQQNIFDFKKYLYDLYHDPNKINYASISDLCKNYTDDEKNYKSAFRIIGEMKSSLRFYKNILFPKCSYFSEYDLDVLPNWQAKINNDETERDKFNSLNSAHKIMKLRILLLMKEIPFLKPYFELLKYITFAIHYLPNLQSSGLFPIFNDTLQNEFMGEKYCKSIPKVFPPLPIMKKITLDVKIYIRELFDIFKSNNYSQLNQFLSICFYETEPSNFEKAIKKQNIFEDAIKKFTVQKILMLMDEQDKYKINFFSDEILRIKSITKNFINELFNLAKIDLLKDYFIIYNALSSQKNEMYLPKNDKQYIYSITSFKELKKEIEEILNLFGIYSMQTSEERLKELEKSKSDLLKKIEENKNKDLKKLKDELINMIKQKNNNNITEEQINSVMNKPEVKAEYQKQENKINVHYAKEKKKLIDKMNESLNNIKNLFETHINNLNNLLNSLQKKLINYNVIDNGLIKNYCSKSNLYVNFTINYTKSIFLDNKENEKYSPIIGGCLPEINNNIVLRENEEFNDLLYQEFINKKIRLKRIRNKKYYFLKTELRNGFIYGHILHYFTRTIDKNKIIMQILSSSEKAIPNHLKNIKDFSGNSLGYYDTIINTKFGYDPETKNDNKENNFGERPEIFAIENNNFSYIKKLISLPISNFSGQTEGGLTPLGLAIINRSKKIVKLLLEQNNINKIGNINQTNELRLTYLHLAVSSNMDYAVKALIEKGCDISISTLKEENSPIHLMGILARNEIILNICKNQNFIKNLNNQRPDGKTALHFMSANSILGTKLLIKNGANCDVIDSFRNNAAKYAFYSGRFDCFNLILNYNKNKKDIFLKNKILELISQSNEKKDDINNININNYMNFKNLKILFENNDEKKIKIILEKMKKIKIKLPDEEIYELIDLTCRVRNINLLKLLNEFKLLKDFHIGPFIGKYGLISWLEEMPNIGCELFTKSENILNNKNIFDFCLINNDKKLLKNLFNINDKNNDKNSEKFMKEISNLFCKALLFGNIKILEQIYRELHSNNNYKDKKLSLVLLSKSHDITLNKLKKIMEGFDIVDIKSLDIKNVAKFCRPNILEFMLDNSLNKTKDIKFLIELKNIIKKNNRFDNLYMILNRFPEINENEINIEELNTKLLQIEELFENKNDIGLENILKEKLNSLIKNINIGFIKFPINNTYFPHLIIKSCNLWAFDILKKFYNDEEIFCLDEELKTCFDYLEPNRNMDVITFEDLDKIIRGFGTKFYKILKVIDIFTKNLKKSHFQCNDEYLTYLFSALPKKIFISYDEKYNSIFHIISSLNLDKNINTMIINILKEIKSKNVEAFKTIINLQNTFGDTFLFKFLQNENYDISIDIFKLFYDEININLCNSLGNSILHILFLNKNFNSMKNNFIIFEKIYQLLLNILKKNKKLIFQLNRKNNTPYELAANSGCNLAIRIMLEFYNIEYLESFSENSTALHLACFTDNINTVRFLIECEHYDPNIKLKNRAKKNLGKLSEGSTPLHAAALSSSIELFDYLLLHGSNPFIQNSENKDPIDIGYQYGNYNFLKYIFKLKCSKRYSANDKYILSLIKNKKKGSYQIFMEYLKENSFQNFNIVDEDMNILLILACKSNNPEFISTLINAGIDPLIKNKYGFNCLHISSYYNTFSCAGLVLSKLEAFGQIEKIKNLLSSKNNEGETPLHIAVKLNLENIFFLYISFLIRNNIILEKIKNSAGLNVLQLAIKMHNYKMALIYIKYLNLEYLKILEEKNSNISKEFDDFIYDYDSGVLKKYESIIEEKFENINYHLSQKNTVPKEYKENYLKQVEKYKGINYNEFNGGLKIKSFEYLKSNLNLYYKCELLQFEFFYENKNILGNIYIIMALIRLAKEKKEYLIDLYFQILMQLNSNNKFILEKNKNDNINEIHNIIEIMSVECLPYMSAKQISSILGFFQEIINITKNVTKGNNFLNFINHSIISYFESKFIKPKLNIFIEELLQLMEKIYSDEKFISYFNYTSSAFKSYEFVFKLNKILKSIKDKQTQLFQIKNMNSIPCILDDEISKLLSENHIINEYILNENLIYDFAKLILKKNNKNINMIDNSLQITKRIKDCPELNQKEKEIIVKNIIIMYEKYIKNNNISNDDISNFLSNFFHFSKQILLYKKLEEYSSIISEMLGQTKSFCELIPYLFIYSSPKEIIFPNLEQKLNYIIRNIQLDNNEKNMLSQIANLIPEYCEKFKYNKDYENLGKKIGKDFINNLDIKNLSKLVALISLGVLETMNMIPYLIQCLSVSSFLLHYIIKDKNENYKGKLAQIKTGEGKSLIIAMLSLSNALIGNLVDVITSTHYLAERDQKKFKKLYDKFGISSSNIIKNNPSKSDYNAIILYGTNTDFEFSLLREGIYNQKKMYTVPLNSDDNSLIKRTFDVAIVDECDNLFLDTARNSARISHPSKYNFNWIYPLIYDYFTKNENNFNIDILRNILNTYESGKYKLESEKLDNDRLKELFRSAKIAKDKKLNLDYVIGIDYHTNKKIIQIVSLDTGRIQHGTRWSNGIHEFVEVKEGIEPETESNVIGSISHPTYFENYKILFGLTGTIGDEIERKEIELIYKIKCYDIPTNFEGKLINENLEIYENKKEKFKRILDIILLNKTKGNKALPILVILQNIEETIDFGKILSEINLEYYTLNDIQKENEDFILNNTGHSGSILIATNAAGRGTDIIIDETSKKNGGLYVIIGFFPRNSRIEFQAIGRAGRQGNPGKAKIIISRDEEFIYYNYYFINKIKNQLNDEIKALYLFRQNDVRDLSFIRIKFCEKERIYFNVLKKFFLLKELIISLSNNNLFKFYFDYIISKIGINVNFEYYRNFIMINLENIWAEFYSELIKSKKYINYVNENSKKDYFIDFLIKLEKELSDCLKEIYGDKDKNLIEIDITKNAIKNLENKMEQSIQKNNISPDNYNYFKLLFEKLQFVDLIKFK